MRKQLTMIGLVALVLIALAFALRLNLNPTLEQDTSNESSIVTEPKPINWSLSKNLVAEQGDTSLAVHFISLSGKQTVLIYSVAAPNGIDTNGLMIDLVETGKGKYAEKRQNILGQLEDLQFIALTSEGQKSKGAEIHLNLVSLEIPTGLDVKVTESLNGNAEGLPLSGNDNDAFARTGTIAQGKFLISFNGTGLYTGDLEADRENAPQRTQEEDLQAAQSGSKISEPQPTPAIAQPRKLTLELAAGKPILGDGTLRIENVATKQVKFLYFVILDDGEVRARILE